MKQSKYFGKFKENDKFGNWTVKDSHLVIDDKSNAFVWCRCECGIQRLILCNSLMTKRTTKCQACNRNNRTNVKNPNWKGVGDISKTTISNVMRRVSTIESNSLITNYSDTCSLTGQALTPTSAQVMFTSTNQPRWVHEDVYAVFRPSANFDEIVTVVQNIIKLQNTEEPSDEKSNKKATISKKSK